MKGSGSTAAAELTRAALTNASATGNAQMSLTYDSVGSGQGAHAPRYTFPGPAALSEVPAALLGAFRARLVHAADGCAGPAGQKNLLQNAYDYAISDVPLSEAVYNSSSKCVPHAACGNVPHAWAHCAKLTLFAAGAGTCSRSPSLSVLSP